MDQSETITIAVLAAFALLLLAIGIADHRRTRRRAGRPKVSGILGSIDDVFHPEAARAIEIREVQRELPAEAPTPGDPLLPGGPIVIGRVTAVGSEGQRPAHPEDGDARG